VEVASYEDAQRAVAAAEAATRVRPTYRPVLTTILGVWLAWHTTRTTAWL
jgi:hypothetical protein